MALYLAEVYLKEGYKRGYELLNQAVKQPELPARRDAQGWTMGVE